MVRCLKIGNWHIGAWGRACAWEGLLPPCQPPRASPQRPPPRNWRPRPGNPPTAAPAASESPVKAHSELRSMTFTFIMAVVMGRDYPEEVTQRLSRCYGLWAKVRAPCARAPGGGEAARGATAR